MKPHLTIIRIVMLLFIVNSFSTTGISQDTTYTKFIEAGGGMGYSESMHGAFNGGLTFFFHPYLTSIADYNQFYGKSGTLFHEINLKIGPYIRIRNNTYISLSVGISYIFNPSEYETNYSGDLYLPVTTYKENKFLNVPIQLKINVGLSTRISVGLKGTYNYLWDEYEEDKGTIVFFLSYAF